MNSPKTRRMSTPVTSLLALLGLIFLGGICGWFLRDQLTQDANHTLRQQLFLQTLVRAHRMFGPDEGIGPTFAPEEFDRFASSVDRQLEIALQLPRQSPWSSAYRGGRILPLLGGPAALLMFGQDQDRVSLVMAPRGLQLAPEGLNQTVDDTAIAVTTRGPLQVVAIGPLSGKDFDTLTGMIVR
jgi:hypothetical protein